MMNVFPIIIFDAKFNVLVHTIKRYVFLVLWAKDLFSSSLAAGGGPNGLKKFAVGHIEFE